LVHLYLQCLFAIGYFSQFLFIATSFTKHLQTPRRIIISQVEKIVWIYITIPMDTSTSTPTQLALPMKGGNGAADYMIKVAGDMGQQSSSNGVLQYKMAGGKLLGKPRAIGSGTKAAFDTMEGGDPTLGQMAVPAALVLASQYVNSMMPKKGGKRQLQQGGIGMTEVAVPAVLVLASNMFGKGRSTRKMRGGESVTESVPVGDSKDDDSNSQHDGGAVPMVIPAGLLLANTLMPKMLGRRASMKSARRFRHRKSRRGLRKQKK
jgi:hypothetical protein